MSNVKVSRQSKNLMRKQLEDILSLQKDIEQKIDHYQQESEVEEYQAFWQELSASNREHIQKISRYAVAKCNR